MRLGETLIRDGRLTEEQLSTVLDFQKSDGGRLGSIMVELGFVDTETLTVYLGLELGIPIATGATLERCKRSAVRLLSPQQAFRFQCIPIVIQGQTLIVAIDDPFDVVVLDGLAATTGYRIIPRVAPEIRIFYYLERFYGVKRPPRFAKLGDSPRGDRSKGSANPDLPAPPLPGLPPKIDPVAAPTAAPKVTISTSKQPEKFADVASEADDLVGVLEADKDEIAKKTDQVRAATAPVRTRPQTKKEGETYEPLDHDQAIAAMSDAQTRGDIATILLRYGASLFETSAVFIVRDNMAFGWKGFGPDLDNERFDTILLPLERQSLLQRAVHNKGYFSGRPFPATLHDYLYRALRCAAPATATALAISIGNRLVNILYGHKTKGEALTDEEASSLREIGTYASLQYVQLITVRKKRRERADTHKDDDDFDDLDGGEAEPV